MGRRVRSAAAAIFASALFAPLGCGGTAGSTGGVVAGTGGGEGGTSGTGGAARGGTGGDAGAGSAAGMGGGGHACVGHDIDVPVAIVTGSLTVGGVAVPSAGDRASIFLRNATSGSSAPIGFVAQGTYTVRLVPGTYDVYYAGDDTLASAVPSNSFARVRTGVVIPSGSSSLDIDVPVATVMVSFSANGVSVPSPSTFAGIYLENATTKDRVYLSLRQGTHTARLVPGTYDVRYEGGDTASPFPLNSFARLRTGVVIPAGSSSLTIDVPVATVAGLLTVGGVAVSLPSHFSISIRSADTGDTFIGALGESTYTARLMPGAYDVYYLADNNSTTVPRNDRARVRTGVVIPSGSSSLNIDIPVATVTGALTVDGAADPTAGRYGAVFLRNAITDDAVDLGYPGQGTYTAPLIPGTYDVYYSAVTGIPTLPISSGRIRAGVVIPSGASSLDVDVPVATVSGSFTVNGVAAPSTSDDARIMVQNVTTDWVAGRTTVGYVGQTSYTARLIPGTYDVYYEIVDRSSSTLPISSGKIRTGVVIPSGASSLDVDIPVATITGSLTVAGVAAPSTIDYGRITLKNATTGHTATLGNTTQSTYTARLIPGTYDAYYALETLFPPDTAASVVPLIGAKLRCISVP